MKRHPSKGVSVRRRRTAAEIRSILQQQQQSGLSLLAFAQEHQLCYGTLLRWKSRPPKSETHPDFIPVQVEPESLGPDYVLSWPTGRSLRIPSQFDPQKLRRLLGVLEECQ